MLVDGTENRTDQCTLGVIDLTDMYIANQSSEDIKSLLNSLAADGDWVVLDLKTASIESIQTTMDTMNIMFTLFGLIALILSTVLIVNIFNIIREEQEYETGMFQAIGASKRETFRLFLIQGGIMGVIGASLGTLAAYFIAKLIFNVTSNSMINLVSSSAAAMVPMNINFSITLVPSTIILTFSIGLIACLVAAIFPSLKATRKPIIECLNPIEEQKKRNQKKYAKSLLMGAVAIILIVTGVYLLRDAASDMIPAFEDIAPANNGGFPAESMGGDASAMIGPVIMLFGALILGTVFLNLLIKIFVKIFKPYLKHTSLLTEKNILRHHRRTVLTFWLIALTTSYLIGMSVMVESMRAGVDTTIDDMVGSDLQIYAFAPSDFKDKILDMEGVDQVLKSNTQNALVKVGDQWIGHDLFTNDANSTVSVNVVDSSELESLIEDVKIHSPGDITPSQIVNSLESEGKILVTKKFADQYNVTAGDTILVNFTLDSTFPNVEAMFTQNITDVKVNYHALEMEIVAVVEKVQGFDLSALMGAASGNSYRMFISWNTYLNSISSNSLPGQDIDLVLRTPSQTGNPEIDAVFPNWVNISDINSVLAGIDSLEYTTRMEFTMMTNAINPTPMGTTLVGVHTETDGVIMADNTYGTNILVEKNQTYTGNTMEDLLDTAANVCVVDEDYVSTQITGGDDDFGIGSHIKVYPRETLPMALAILPAFDNTFIVMNNGTWMGLVPSMNISDNSNYTMVSQGGILSANISVLTMPYTFNSPQPIQLTIESRVNKSIESMEIQALNLYTNQYESIGLMNSVAETNYTFTFNPNHMYVNMANGFMELRVVGFSSDSGNEFQFDIDTLYAEFVISAHSLFDNSTWPTYEVVGIIQSSNLYNTESYIWPMGYEVFLSGVGNAIYLNYENARDQVFVDFKGSDIHNDLVTSVLVNCNNVSNIAHVKSALTENLPNATGVNWTIADTKTLQFTQRNMVLSWFIWLEEGVNQEEAMKEIQAAFQANSGIVLFGFTRDFASSSFSTMINLMSYIMYGVLLLAMLIALIGLALHCLLTTMARRREIGMLRSIGLNQEGVIRSISGETLIIALIGVAVGIGAGLMQGALTTLAMPTGGFLSITFVIPWNIIIGLIVITIIAAILSSMVPARWAAKLNIIDAVRTR